MASQHLDTSADDVYVDITGAGTEALAPSCSEFELLALAQSGDLSAFEALYRRHAPRIEMICRARLHDQADVADAVQETFARAFRQLHRFRGGLLFGHWLSRIARNTAIDCTRKARLREVPLDEAAAVGAAGDAPGASVQRMAVRSMLASLSTRDARLLVGHHVEGRSVRELASQWGLTEGAMAVALQRARVRARAAALRESLPAVIGLASWRGFVTLYRRLRHGFASAATVPVLAAAIVLVPMIVPVVRMPLPAELENSHTRPASEGHAATSGDTGGTESGNAGRLLPQGHAELLPGTVPTERPRPQPPVVPFEPVDLPGTGRRLHAERPNGPADYEVGVQAESGQNRVKAEIEAFDEPAARPAHEATCTAADAAPAVAYCKRGRESPDTP
jgi:RNA polymerase sigma-70 factor (ECF subfamily)